MTKELGRDSRALLFLGTSNGYDNRDRDVMNEDGSYV